MTRMIAFSQNLSNKDKDVIQKWWENKHERIIPIIDVLAKRGQALQLRIENGEITLGQ